MNPCLVDASILLASEDPDDEHHEDSRRLLPGSDPLVTLDLAFYEVTNVAVRSWRDQASARRLRGRVAAVADDAGLVRADTHLLEDPAAIADEHGISAYDAAYVVAARAVSARLVSCDLRDLVSRDLAVLPSFAVRQPGDQQPGPPAPTSP